ncbi:MAG: hypothetical protein HC767_14785 [Akkermansiaceae bacterium]|nr:hypothetical protein [Akkermansiaceae bacterium]
MQAMEEMKAQGVDPTNYMSEMMADPEVMELFMKPHVTEALMEIQKNPQSAVNYMSDPDVSKLMSKMMSIQSKIGRPMPGMPHRGQCLGHLGLEELCRTLPQPLQQRQGLLPGAKGCQQQAIPVQCRKQFHRAHPQKGVTRLVGSCGRGSIGDVPQPQSMQLFSASGLLALGSRRSLGGTRCMLCTAAAGVKVVAHMSLAFTFDLIELSLRQPDGTSTSVHPHKLMRCIAQTQIV